MKKLVQDLVKIRVRPYYIYQCDLSEGIGHFRAPVSKGIEIIEHLRGHTSGYAVPTFVVDAPHGGGKIPVSPNYIISQASDKVVLRNFEGVITSYPEPKQYHEHDEENCEYCIAAKARQSVSPRSCRMKQTTWSRPTCRATSASRRQKSSRWPMCAWSKRRKRNKAQ